ncbi:hypothetical protein [[Clostridium] colinum]|uniref:hypothetical protein n=1 Tax=[Clostridium] colinum TaxID=36835 RepID=UPI0020256C7D|nr:hypothetical protein [[Clostridium] colinum]
MIATLHYYNSYKPFVLDKKKSRERKISPDKKYNKQVSKYKNSEISYFLNKSLNDNVKSYMFELSSNFNSLKNISNNIYEKMHYNLPSETLEENFEKFTSTYNRFIGFLEENAENSSSFKNMLNSTKDIVNNNIDILNDMGINMSKTGFLNVNNDENKNIMSIDNDKIKSFYHNLYEKMCDFMEEPMSNHMDFKDFSYYFNYSGDYDKNKSFKIIEQGILVDIVV